MVLLVTNPVKRGEEVFVKGDARIVEEAFGVELQNGRCFIPQTLSRKKDFVPRIEYFCTTPQND